MRIRIHGAPVAQKRPRFARRGKHVVTYSEQETEAGRFIALVRDQAPETPLTGPLCARLAFFVPRPRCHYGTGKNAGKLKDSAPEWPDKKPDLSNYVKFAEDCLNGVAWHDDAAIVCYLAGTGKYYADDAAGPRTEIDVMPAEFFGGDA